MHNLILISIIKCSLRLVTLFCACLLICSPIHSQSPTVHCVNVVSSGDVELTWEPTVNLTSVFHQYNIYGDLGAGFVLITSLTNVNTSNYTVNGAGANLTSRDFYITVVYDNGTAIIELPPEDTLSSIFLDVNNPSDGTAILQWNDLIDPIPLEMGSYYYIWRQLNAGLFELTDSILFTGANYYRDTITVCSANLNYEIRVNNSEGCVSTSNIDGDLFQDLIAPNSPVFNNVSVDSISGNSVLNWNPSTSEDASAYIIVVNIGGAWQTVDTIYGYNNTYYEYLNSNADLISEGFGIAAFDSCWNGNPPSPNTSPLGTPNYTIHAVTAYNTCDIEISMKWNSYINWPSGVNKYEVFRSDENGPYAQVATLSDTSFLDTDLNSLQNYCYVIRAISGDDQDTALSNVVCRYTKQPPKPSYAYLANVTVVDSKVELEFNPDLSGITTEIEIFKSIDQGLTFDSYLVETNLTGVMLFDDIEVAVDAEIYRYKVEVRDSCGNVALTSNLAQNILLNVEANSNSMINYLQWTPYKQWNGNVVGYEVFRSINGVFSTTPIAIISSSNLYYEDDISGLIGTNANGNFCYYIEAIEGVNSFGTNRRSRSNEVCVNQEPLIFVPNALYIDGYNSIWKPVINMIDVESYSLNIYSRMGKSIFESSDINAFWDGKHKGEYVPFGVYIYHINYQEGSGGYGDLRGTITVIR